MWAFLGPLRAMSTRERLSVYHLQKIGEGLGSGHLQVGCSSNSSCRVALEDETIEVRVANNLLSGALLVGGRVRSRCRSEGSPGALEMAYPLEEHEQESGWHLQRCRLRNCTWKNTRVTVSNLVKQ